MPVSAQIGFVVGNYHHMERSRGDCVLTTRTDVGLAGGIRLNRMDRYPQIAHASSPTMTRIVTPTSTPSKVSLRAGRKGLKPTKER